MTDLAGDIPFFVGEEEPQIAIAIDQPLVLQASEAFLNLALECELVRVDLVDAERRQVVDAGPDDVRNVANQEQCFEQQNIVRLQRGIGRRFVDGALGAGVDEALDGRVEIVKRDQGFGATVGVALGCRLECVEQGALTLGEVLAGGAHFANGLEHLL